ncbi:MULTISPECIES: hypothetical protein [Caballeronia]|uniref:hypothetical protein n=1 Tax=Caballeronia TaxID=1827195 RepID=UPI001EF71953|nr:MULTISPECIES: hypothetical protein [Caballeronia]MCG7400492.1 hypothetical protein [Caballeronia zhejiangensis]
MAPKNWSDVLLKQTRDVLQHVGCSTAVMIPLKHVDGRFGIASGNAESGSYLVADRASCDVQVFTSVTALIENGWAID